MGAKQYGIDEKRLAEYAGQIAEAVRGSMEAGATGVALFIPSNMTDEHWAEFDKAIHQTYQVKK